MRYFLQEIVRQEMLSVHPEERQIDGTDLPHLMAAICETQRIRSIVPVGIPHGCLEVNPMTISNLFPLAFFKSITKTFSPNNPFLYM